MDKGQINNNSDIQMKSIEDNQESSVSDQISKIVKLDAKLGGNISKSTKRAQLLLMNSTDVSTNDLEDFSPPKKTRKLENSENKKLPAQSAKSIAQPSKDKLQHKGIYNVSVDRVDDKNMMKITSNEQNSINVKLPILD